MAKTFRDSQYRCDYEALVELSNCDDRSDYIVYYVGGVTPFQIMFSTHKDMKDVPDGTRGKIGMANWVYLGRVDRPLIDVKDAYNWTKHRVEDAEKAFEKVDAAQLTREFDAAWFLVTHVADELFYRYSTDDRWPEEEAYDVADEYEKMGLLQSLRQKIYFADTLRTYWWDHGLELSRKRK